MADSFGHSPIAVSMPSWQVTQQFLQSTLRQAQNFGNIFPEQVANGGAMAGSHLAEFQGCEHPGLWDTVKGGVLFGGPLMLAPHMVHAADNFNAAKAANAQFRSIFGTENPLKALAEHNAGDFKYLSALEKERVYKNLYHYERLIQRIPESANATQIKELITAQRNAYMKAVQAGDVVGMAKAEANMGTMLRQARNKNWFLRLFQGKTVTDAAAIERAGIASANAAEKTAKSTLAAAQTTAAKTGTASAASWTKGAMKAGGAGFMGIIEGTIETFTAVIPAYQKSPEDGHWQLGKSAAKVGGSVAGWCIGSAAGSALGAKVGAAIGTAVCPGLGTVIGGAIGLVGGLVGSWIGRKIAEKAGDAVEGACRNPQNAQGNSNSLIPTTTTARTQTSTAIPTTPTTTSSLAQTSLTPNFGNYTNLSLMGPQTNPFTQPGSFNNQFMLDNVFNAPTIPGYFA